MRPEVRGNVTGKDIIFATVITVAFVIIMFYAMNSGQPGILTRERMRQDSLGKVVYIGGVKIVTVDDCQYLVINNGYKGGVSIIHKVNCNNHTK